MKVPLYTREGEIKGEIELPSEVFGVPVNEALLHQAIVMYQANQRAGTASTKTRGEVKGSTRKLYPQKHTGRARAGSIRSPIRRHGGIVFGPKPRSYYQRMPKKMRRLALKCALSAKLRDGELKVIDDFGLSEPRTKEMREILSRLGIEKSALIVTGEAKPPVYLSARNLPKVDTSPAHTLNAYKILRRRHLVLEREAVEKIKEIWGDGSSKRDKGS